MLFHTFHQFYQIVFYLLVSLEYSVEKLSRDANLHVF
jgi:hypothetical protein